MAVGTYRGVNNVARKVKKQWRGVDNLAREIKKEWRGVSNVARQVFSGDLYLIQNGKYNFDFITINAWDKYTAPDSAFKVTEGDQYIEIYNYGYRMGAVITKNAIDLSQYSTLNIECEVKLKSNDTNSKNYVFIGASTDNTNALTNNTSTGGSTLGEQVIFRQSVYSKSGSMSDFEEVMYALDISNYSDLGYIFAYPSSLLRTDDESYLRIKNLWLE